MPRIDRFLDKLLNSLDKIDRESLRAYVVNISKEKDFLYSVLKSLPFALLLIDKDQKVFFVNAYAKDLLMRPNSEESSTCNEIFTDSILSKSITTNLKAQLRIIDELIEIIQPSVKKLIVNAYPLFDEQNIMHAYVVTMKDLRVEEKIEELRRHETINSLTTLAAGLAHEIGNPLNTIKIYLKLISKEVAVSGLKKIEDFVSVVSDETDRLDKLIKNFLKVTRSKVSLHTKKNFHDSLERSVHFFNAQLQENNIKLEVDLDPKMPKFYLDNDRLYEAFINILKNSIEAMPYGGSIKIKTTFKDGVANIFIQDSGIGIDEHDLPHIFDAYYTNKKEGSGLGLMNVYSIVKAHNGRIHVESTKGEGTIVVISLPVKKDKLRLPLFTHKTKGDIYEH
jgi:signal transduction histidine kinase